MTPAPSPPINTIFWFVLAMVCEPRTGPPLPIPVSVPQNSAFLFYPESRKILVWQPFAAFDLKRALFWLSII